MPGLPGDLPPPGTGCWKKAVILAVAGFTAHRVLARIFNG